jgi:hypothetical protein
MEKNKAEVESVGEMGGCVKKGTLNEENGRVCWKKGRMVMGGKNGEKER